MKKLITVINAAFVLLIFFFLAGGLGKAVFDPISLNEYENRGAYVMPELSVKNFLSGSFQNGVQRALGDQTPCAIDMKKAYNSVRADIQLKYIGAVREQADSAMYIGFNGLVYKDGYLMETLRDLSEEKEGIDECVDNMVSAVSATPEVPVYVYYIKRDEDTYFKTGEQSGFYEYLAEELGKSRLFTQVSCYDVPTVEDYMRDFLKTDHHWNSVGAQRGYEEVLSILAPEQNPVRPSSPLIVLDYDFVGAYARTSGAVGYITEDFLAYDYQLPQVQVRFNNSSHIYPNYGGRQYYLAGLVESAAVSYSDYYGSDISRIVLDNPNNSAGENLLLIGDSFDNAILWLLSGHFDTLHSIDIRPYESDMGEPFSYGKYIRENNITKVMFIGSNDFFCGTLQDMEG